MMPEAVPSLAQFRAVPPKTRPENLALKPAGPKPGTANVSRRDNVLTA